MLYRYLIASRVLSSNSNRTELSGDLNERRGETPLHSAFGALCSTRCSADPLCCTISVSCQVPIKRPIVVLMGLLPYLSSYSTWRLQLSLPPGGCLIDNPSALLWHQKKMRACMQHLLQRCWFDKGKKRLNFERAFQFAETT